MLESDPELHLLHARRAGDRARGLSRRPARERGPPAGAARGRPPRGRAELHPPRRAARRRRAAGSQPPDRPSRVPALRRRAVAGRLHARQLRPSAPAPADPGRVRDRQLHLLARAGRRARRASGSCSGGARPTAARCARSSSCPRTATSTFPVGRRAGADRVHRRAVRPARCSAPAWTRCSCATARTTVRDPPRPARRCATSSSAGCPGTSFTIAALLRLRGRRRTGRAAGVHGRAARQPPPERAPRRQLGAALPQARQRASRAAAARGRDAGRAPHAPRRPAASRSPTSGSRGGSCSSATRTTRSAAARATRSTATCSFATSSSSGRCRTSSADALAAFAATADGDRRRRPPASSTSSPTAGAASSSSPGTSRP